MNDTPQDGLPPPGRHRGHRKPDPDQRTREGGAPDTSNLVGLRGSKSLERLRDRIQTAASEILRLREENAALAARLEKLEARSITETEEGSLIRFDEDPEALRRKVNGFIEVIDKYLEGEQK